MWLKLGRAEELLNRLNTEVDAWNDSTPYLAWDQWNQDHTAFRVIARLLNDPPLHRWSLMFADFIHNLRCVLDHMIWAIAVHEDPTLTVADDRGLMFPIWIKPPNADDRKRIKRLSPAVRNAILYMQPHSRTITTGHAVHPLAILGDFDNTNKHKLLKLAKPAVAQTHVKVRATFLPGEKKPQHFIYRGELKGDTEVFRIVFLERPHADAQITYDLGFIIAIIHELTSSTGTDRDDYSSLADILIAEVLTVIGAVCACVA